MSGPRVLPWAGWAGQLGFRAGAGSEEPQHPAIRHRLSHHIALSLPRHGTRACERRGVDVAGAAVSEILSPASVGLVAYQHSTPEPSAERRGESPSLVAVRYCGVQAG
ncbi:unnamed protein product [Diplocarpon coronariae]